MSQNQRKVSQPLDLHSFSIVNKQSEPKDTTEGQVDKDEQNSNNALEKRATDNSEHSHSRNSSDIKLKPISPRKAGIQLPLPLQSTPVKNQKHERMDSNKEENIITDETYQELLYKLATKKRTVTELIDHLKKEEKELRILEDEISRYAEKKGIHNQNNILASPRGKGNNEMIQSWAKQIHSAIDEVNNSPNVVNGKKSISDFFYKQQDNEVKSRNYKVEKPFFKQLVDKFSEFTFNEDDEEEFDKSRNLDEYSVNNNFNYEYDESNIDDEEEPEGILNIGLRKPRVSKPLTIKK
ncbi:hypothetical protein TPHA_0E00590 [Tetrapisispora phaffii CBS 4417]|uniref:Uncharacterized protein n=1 Tax=Tetrapisispora phaffii (strain ATCC 24235 / CBS 4417 / NBRC 1672 / NRRL Y-8282 / UCD 70-5) TaxID=1071381 RepID=G8BTC6_TETPH|nr:hypothetical protein TPHA_0E00590 [Tetrapisispora phaffii CBS 4417]CCE63154.1 hypothetical protein TPHA_0E00590 [Tetrapisispora phaffii CBS 4417]